MKSLKLVGMDNYSGITTKLEQVPKGTILTVSDTEAERLLDMHFIDAADNAVYAFEDVSDEHPDVATCTNPDADHADPSTLSGSGSAPEDAEPAVVAQGEDPDEGITAPAMGTDDLAPTGEDIAPLADAEPTAEGAESSVDVEPAVADVGSEAAAPKRKRGGKAAK